MSRKIGLSLLLVSIFVLGLAVAPFNAAPKAQPVAAQDESGMVVCDAGTILLLFVAEADYGYAPEDMDLAMFDKGQFAPLFDMMMTMMMDEDMMEEDDDMMMSEEDMAMMEEAMDAMMEEMDMDMMTMLSTVIEGEPAECSALREAIIEHIVLYNYADMMMMEGEDM